MGAVLSSRIPRELARVGLMFAIIMGIIGGLYFLAPSAEIRQIYMDVVPPILEFGVAVVLFLGARALRRALSPQAASWLILGVAVLLYAVGDAVWAYQELGAHEAPFPSIADVFYLAYYPVFAIGVIRL